MSQVIIATATMYRGVDDHRAQVALRTIQQAVKHGHKIVIVDNSPQEVKDMLNDAGAVIFQDEGKTMGQGRRQAIKLAMLSTGLGILEGEPAQKKFIAWIEPEKDTIVRHLKHMTHHDITIPCRHSLASYPILQQHAENFGNDAFHIKTGKALDMWFGPRIFSLSAAKYFLEYDGKYGDKWDAIFIPVVRAIADGVNVGQDFVEFAYPVEQLAAEQDDPNMVMKRLEQLNNLIPAIYEECDALGI